MNPVAQRGKNQPKRREVAANPRMRARGTGACDNTVGWVDNKEKPHDFLFDGIRG